MPLLLAEQPRCLQVRNHGCTIGLIVIHHTADRELLLRQGRIAEAEVHINRAARGAESFSTAYSLWGQLDLAKGEFDNALALFSEVVKREPDNTRYQYTLAFVYLQLGKLEEARAMLASALARTELHTQVSEALCELAWFVPKSPDLLELERVRERLLTRKRELDLLAQEECCRP